ncbi:MAG TPA: hypothetical protein VLI05_06085 [Candidatus Saccharimonadia bacterium]|nr:hypothetical protein [Candidatus Saccharimonadia bacterium]
MNLITNHPRLTLGLGGLVVVILLILGLASNSRQAATVVDPAKTTSISSRFSKTSADIAVNSGFKVDPNNVAVHQPFELFGVSSLQISDALTYQMHESLPGQLARAVVPTYAPTYIQVDASSVDCTTDYDCAFSFYIDSPERYFRYHMYYNPDGSQAYSLKQMPLPGGSQ